MVDYAVDGNIAVLSVNNPPVNALSHRVREGLLNGIEKAARDDKVKAVIIIGKGRTFPSGADITEFDKPVREPWLTVVGRAIEASRKPVISALHGAALGGGLEIALFSHYRIASKKGSVGFPEVALGILPGAEGTVRLPRVTGPAVAMEMISSGRRVGAQEALKFGILDKVVEGDLLKEAKLFAESVKDKPLDGRRLKYVKPKGAESVDAIYEGALAEVKKRFKGFNAPVNCLMSVKGAVKLPYEESCALERQLFTELMSGGQSRAQRYAFFAERAATKWRLPCGASAANTKPSEITSTGVIGAGTMGSGIAICLIRVGIPVVMVERDEKMLQKGMRTISDILGESVRRKRMTSERRTECLRLLKGAASLEGLKDVDVVIEAVFENLALKKEIFAKLDKICKPSAILCSNTSTLDIDQIASATSRPDKVMGAHFFSPAYIMRLLENIYGAKTSPQTVATIMQLGKTIGKIPVLVKTCHGFVGNRMNQKFSSEAFFMLEEGALPQDIDQVLEDFGMPMGPFKVGDLAGLDIGWNIRQEVAKKLGVSLTLETKYLNAERYSSLADRLYEMGRHGRKTGKGWYRYEKPMAVKAYPDADVTEMINSHAKAIGLTRRTVSAQEIIERSTYAAINEGFKILEQGVAEKPEDIDVIWLYGFGFPRYRGGPMFYASQVGLSRVYERICHYHKTLPYSSYWVPSDLLRRLASYTTQLPMDQWTKFTDCKL
ncbi:peroxisomal bifunctional enzyme [Aplysia californica]|uniref:Peroxisomal bifunctional enzyme n=1 Tax=Aplysia californica TaxID=6500 RepID=A0ABM0JTH8_APLCA|nr:peroxisomal bifunctional enzyme [Aplysia californica]